MTPARITFAGLAFVLLGSATAVAAPLSEQAVKAAYLLNVLRLTERRPPFPSNELALCTIAAGAVEQPLRSLEGTIVRGRKLSLRNVTNGSVTGCEAIFFGRSAGSEPILATARATGILTMGNDREFLPLSGMVALIVENRRVVVEVNSLAIKHSVWVFSSHLLEIARLTSGGDR